MLFVGCFVSVIHNIQTYLPDTDNQQKQEKYLQGVLKTKATAKNIAITKVKRYNYYNRF